MSEAMTAGRSQKILGAERAREHIENSLLSGEIAPAERINIKSVAEAVDVSLGAVREALSSLAVRGFVTALPQRGYCAASVSKDDLIQLTEARIVIEAQCAQLSIERGSLDWEARVAAAHHKLVRTSDSDQVSHKQMPPQWADAHSVFHDAIASGCENAWLLSTRDALFSQSERYRRLAFPLSRSKRDIGGEHASIFEAVIRRDTNEARQLLAMHLQKTADLIIQSNFFSPPRAIHQTDDEL